MSSSSTNIDAGGRTPISSLVASFAALLTVLFFSDLLSTLPEAALGVLIIHAVWRHVTARQIRVIRAHSRAEANIAIVAFFGVLILDVLWGLIVAMMLSLLWFVGRQTSARFWNVGPSDKHDGSLVHENDEHYTPVPHGVVSLRFAGNLFYGNVQDAIDRLTKLVRGTGDADHPENHTLILDLEGQEFIDYSAARKMNDFFHQLARKGVHVDLVGVRDELHKTITSSTNLPDNVTFQQSTNLGELLTKASERATASASTATKAD